MFKPTLADSGSDNVPHMEHDSTIRPPGCSAGGTTRLFMVKCSGEGNPPQGHTHGRIKSIAIVPSKRQDTENLREL